MGTENEPSERAGRGMVQRRDSQLKQVADSIHSLQRRISNIGADLTAEDINALLDPSSMVATTLADTQEREETTTLEQKTEIERRPMDARHVRRDEIAFFCGVLNVALTAFIIGRSPSTYYVYWTVKSVLLFTWRFITYRRKSLQWLMLELCYFGNFVGLIHVWFFPESMAQRRLTFAFASGPLMFSIAVMRNSLVFHDVDKSTTLMMHASPAMAAWTLRWYDDKLDGAMAPLDLPEALRDLVVIPVMYYVIWVLLYYLVVFRCFGERIRRKGGVTMFDLMVPKDRDVAKKKSPILGFITSFQPRWQPIVYLAFHGTAASLSFFPVVACWNSFAMHTTLLLGLLSLSVWNGGTFYFKVFAKKYYGGGTEAKAKAKSS